MNVSEVQEPAALVWKGLTFWGSRPGGKFRHQEHFDIFEVYPGMPSNFYYSLSRKEDNWVLEGWAYGEEQPKAVLNDLPMLKGASFSELLAAMAVFTEERDEPWSLAYSTPWEQTRLKRRWQSWMRDLPEWVKKQLREQDQANGS